MTQGANNVETITLLGIPASFAIGNVPTPGVDATLSSTIGGPASAGMQLSVFDADSNVITGTYANAVTVTDPDTNGDGSFFRTSACPGAYPVGNPIGSATTATLTSDASSVNFCYGGIAENTQMFTASAASATNGTWNFSPTLAAPVYLPNSATPSGVATGAAVPPPPYADIALFATSGLGSTGSVTYTEAGWTDSPYNQTLNVVGTLACSVGSTSIDNEATVGATANGSNGTVVTVTAIASPTADACPLEIVDSNTGNLSQLSTVLDTSFTSSSFNVNAHSRKH
jgi:hypothetical protein